MERLREVCWGMKWPVGMIFPGPHYNLRGENNDTPIQS